MKTVNNLEQQLRQLRFRPPPPALRARVLPSPHCRRLPSGLVPAVTLACLWGIIALFHFNTPEIAPSTGPTITYAEFWQIKLMTRLQIAVLQNENRLLNFDSPYFSAPKHL